MEALYYDCSTNKIISYTVHAMAVYEETGDFLSDKPELIIYPVIIKDNRYFTIEDSAFTYLGMTDDTYPMEHYFEIFANRISFIKKTIGEGQIDESIEITLRAKQETK